MCRCGNEIKYTCLVHGQNGMLPNLGLPLASFLELSIAQMAVDCVLDAALGTQLTLSSESLSDFHPDYPMVVHDISTLPIP